MRNRLKRWRARQAWLGLILSLDSLVGVFWIGALVGLISVVVFYLPNPTLISERRDLVGFASTLWQVHAGVLAFSAIVITVVVTMVASQLYGRETWQLYRRNSGYFPIICWNLWALAFEGVVSYLVRSTSVFPLQDDKASNLVDAGAFMFLASVGLAVYLYWKTLKFLDPDYVEDLSEREIERGIRDETQREFQRLQQLARERRAKYESL